MYLARDYRHVPGSLRGSVLAIGNFDGLHPGHLAIIERARERACQLGVPLAVMSFYPHPVRKFRGKDIHQQLMSVHVLLRRLRALGVDLALVQRFSDAFCHLKADCFVHEVLQGALAVRAVVTGQGFVFGHQRSGSEATLRAMQEAGMFEYHALPPVTMADGQAYASSAARKAVTAGEMQAAQQVLGREYGWMGRVIHGHKRGRTIGFPTANLMPPPGLRPPFGVYAVRVWDADLPKPEAMDGVANWGVRPSFGVHNPILEVHLPDRDIDLYGRRLYVEWVRKLRPEQRFENTQQLCQQIQLDCQQARQLLATHPVAAWPF